MAMPTTRVTSAIKLNTLSCFTFFTKQSGSTHATVMPMETILTPSCTNDVSEQRKLVARKRNKQKKKGNEKEKKVVTLRRWRFWMSEGMNESIFLAMKMV
jgi:hypothetical protein